MKEIFWAVQLQNLSNYTSGSQMHGHQNHLEGCGLLGLAPNFLIHRSGEERDLRTCMLNMQSKFPDDMLLLIGTTLREPAVWPHYNQGLLTAKPWAGHCQVTL